MKIKFTIVLIIFSFITLILLCSCEKKTEVIISNPLSTDDPQSLYPITSTLEQMEQMYPIDEFSNSYSKEMRGPDFNIVEPVRGGDLVISGFGPAGVPIVLVDVTLGGEILGYTTIDKDGLFEFTLEESLDRGHSIGLQLGDLSNTDFEQSQFIYNATYFERPMIGILFDLVYVIE